MKRAAVAAAALVLAIVVYRLVAPPAVTNSKPSGETIVAFGDNAQLAYDVWAASNASVAQVPVVKIAHPAAVDRTGSGKDPALKGWAKAITTLRSVVSADPDGDAGLPNFGSYFTENDYARIPRWDLPTAAGVRLAICEPSGRCVRVLLDSHWQERGPHEIIWDGSDDAGLGLSSGVYVAHLTASGRSESLRLVLLK